MTYRFERHLPASARREEPEGTQKYAFLLGLAISILLLLNIRFCQERSAPPPPVVRQAEQKKPSPRPPVRPLPRRPSPPPERPRVIRSGIYFAYDVQAGDTPRSVSRRFLGVSTRFHLILDAGTNRPLAATTQLKPGMTLIVPATE